MIEIDNELYAAVQTLGRDTVLELAQGFVRARRLHPVFAHSPAEAASVVNNEAGELMAAVYDKESLGRQRAEALDTAVTAVRYMKLEWLPGFRDRKPVEASEEYFLPKEQVWGDDLSRGVSGAPATLYEVMEETAQEARCKREYNNCPSCGYELDTGWECVRCGADWEMEATGRIGDGYDSLRTIYDMALEQAKSGKGEERHANGLPFDQQPICQGGRRFGPNGLIYQVWKKAHETPVLMTMDNGADRAVRELLGVMNYAAAAIIVIKEGEHGLE